MIRETVRSAVLGSAPSSGPRARIFVATPTYDGTLHHRYVESFVAALVYGLTQRVEMELRVVAGNSLIQYARNQLLREFLEDRSFTHILWIDADLGFDPKAIVRLLNHGKDVVGGVYPMKCMPIEWPYDPVPGEQTSGLHRARTMPGGFLLCSRRVCETLAAQAPIYDHFMGGVKYPTKHVFDVVLQDGSLLGEDVIFSAKAREAGFDIWVDPDIHFAHCGLYQWRGNLKVAIEDSEHRPGHLDRRDVHDLMHFTDPADLLEPLKKLSGQWCNAWAAPPGELLALTLLARRSTRILEFGSGISTLVMAAANPKAQVHAIEHDPEWSVRLIAEGRRLGLTNITVHLSPLSTTDYCYERPDDLEGPFDLVFIDGPVYLDGVGLKSSTDTRRPIYTRFADLLEGATLVIDDITEYRDIAARYRHEEAGERFAVCLPNPTKQEAA